MRYLGVRIGDPTAVSFMLYIDKDMIYLSYIFSYLLDYVPYFFVISI